MTERLFEDDPYLRRCTCTIQAVEKAGVFLDRTVFYPLGGGQPGDHGVIRKADGRVIPVVDTRHAADGRIAHLPGDTDHDLAPGEQVEIEIDWERRLAHMRMHTCLHLLGAVIPFGVTGGNISATRSRLDFDMQETVDKDAVTREVNALIRAGHPVQTRWISQEDLQARPELIRTMSVKPPAHVPRIRLLEIPGIDLQPCGGTHVANTSEIGPVQVSKVEKKGHHNRRVHVIFA